MHQFQEAYAVLEDALIMDYEAYKELFEYDESLHDDDNLLRIIELYKNRQ